MARRGIDSELLLETAERLVDTNGWRSLTMTALAKQLDIRTPSLYSHVDSIEEVLAGVQARAMSSLGNDLQRAAMGRTGAEGLRAMAGAMKSFAEQHPGTYELAMAEPIDRDSLVVASSAAGEALDAMIRSFGVTDVTPELVFCCVSQLHGPLVLDRAGLFRASALDLDAAWAQAVELGVHLLSETATANA